MSPAPIITQTEYTFGELCIRYLAAAERPQAWGLSILPVARAGAAETPRAWLDAPAVRGLPAAWNQIAAWEVDPLVHAHVSGDVLPGGFSNGRTLRNSATTRDLAVTGHVRETRAGSTVLRTTLSGKSGLRCVVSMN
jgi:alpha-galactosidase